MKMADVSENRFKVLHENDNVGDLVTLADDRHGDKNGGSYTSPIDSKAALRPEFVYLQPESCHQNSRKEKFQPIPILFFTTTTI